MGKMRFKLSLVMPHVWFYKLREVGKPARITHPYNTTTNSTISSSSSSSSSSSQNKHRKPDPAAATTAPPSYTSPVNHKANDIPFPAETPKKTPLSKSPLPQLAEDIAILSPLGPIEISIDNWPSIHSGRNSGAAAPAAAAAAKSTMDDDDYTEDDQFPGFSSAPKGKSGSPVTFDVRELERRLMALGSEDRRKYYASPMLSEALPSPLMQDTAHIAASASHRIMDTGCTPSNANLAGKDIPKSPLKSISQSKTSDIPINLHRSSPNAEAHSLRQSSTSSSSDAGIDRGSSSMWEREILSNTSDGSDIEFGHSALPPRPPSQPLRVKPKDRSRVSSAYNSALHNAGGMDLSIINNDAAANVLSPTSMQLIGNSVRFHDEGNDHIEMVHGDIDMGRWQMSKSSGNGMTRSSPRASPNFQQGRRSVDLSDGFGSSIYQGRLSPVLDHGGDMNHLPLLEYTDSGDRSFKGHQRKMSSPVEFSYTGCKERLLSGRRSFEDQYERAASESEMETMSNYTKFKLMQKGFNTIQGRTSSVGGSSPDRGIYSKAASPKQIGQHVDQQLLPRNLSPRLNYRVEQLGSPSNHHTQSDFEMSPYRQQTTGREPNTGGHDEGANWCKVTLNAVREKTRDPNFQKFSTNTGPANSRVFDSFAMMKCCYDPKQDFKESMMEMILEKDLHSSHDLVELLQCYLTLNSEKYQDTILKVFTEVWAEVFQQPLQ